jgi:hypothetical protein
VAKIRDFNNVQTRVEMDLSEVVSHRLEKYLGVKETSGMQQDPILPSKDKASPPAMPTCKQADRVPDYDKEEVVTETTLEDKHPDKSAFREKEAFFQGFQQSGVQSSRSRGRLPNALGLILLIIALSGTGYLVAQYAWGSLDARSSLQSEVLRARKLVICDASGLPRAQLHEENGVIRFDLCDATGRTRASISLGADEEPKFCLLDKDQKKVKEWGWATDGDLKGENLTQETGNSPMTENVTTSQDIVAPKYIGSVTSNKYHYPDCKWGKQILPEKVLNFHSVKEAQEQGYIQCRACRPPLKDTDESQQTKEAPLPKSFGKISVSSDVRR